MEIFQKAFNRERNKLYQKGGRQINKLAGRGRNGFPEYALHFSSARKFYKSGDLNNSLRTINKAIELSTVDDWEQYAFKANILEELEMFQEAMQAYEKAIEINSEDVRVYALYHQIAECYMFLGNAEKALEFYCYAIELKKQHPNSAHDKDWEGIENGVILGREIIHMYLSRGDSYYKLGQLNEAENDCLRALEINPDYANPCLLLFHIYRSAGQGKKATEFLRKAVDLGDVTAQKLLNELCLNYYAKTGNLTAEEKAELGECLNLTYIQHDLAEGKRRSLNLMNKGMNNIMLYSCLATIYEAEGNWKECEEIAKAGIKFEDGNRLFLNLLGAAICKQDVHRIPEGLQYFEKGILAGDERCTKNYNLWKSAAHN